MSCRFDLIALRQRTTKGVLQLNVRPDIECSLLPILCSVLPFDNTSSACSAVYSSFKWLFNGKRFGGLFSFMLSTPIAGSSLFVMYAVGTGFLNVLAGYCRLSDSEVVVDSWNVVFCRGMLCLNVSPLSC